MAIRDPKTLLPQVEKVRDSFGIASLTMVGDRGMISNVQIEAMRAMEGVDWITALKNGAIAKLADAGQLQLDLFDERNLISFTSEDYPGEQLVACRNLELAKLRAAKRKDLIAATERALQKVAGMVAAGKLSGPDKIGVRQDAALTFSVNEERVAAEAALDGLYVIRTSAAEAEMSAEAAVLNYKRLAEVERAFRTLKGVDLHVRPIRHRLEERVKAHIFLSMLAYYVQWHLAEAWKPLLFADEAPANERDPVAPAKRSAPALAKAQTRRLADGSPAFSFRGLLTHLSTIVRNTMRPKDAKPGTGTFTLITEANPKQRQALDLVAAIAA
jgi:transposase